MTIIFALLEIKFQNDVIKDSQFQSYNALKLQCAKAKYASKVTSNEGFKLSLLRYPEDAISSEDKKISQSKVKGGKILK